MRVGVTPVPIPNTMVKTDAADNTWLETTREDRWLPDLWGISSVGRAPALQAGGHEFDSRILHFKESGFIMNPDLFFEKLRKPIEKEGIL